MRRWRVTGWKLGRGEVTVVLEAADHNAAVMAASKRRGLLLVVRSCVLLN
jgi:hypothetical protein